MQKQPSQTEIRPSSEDQSRSRNSLSAKEPIKHEVMEKYDVQAHGILQKVNGKWAKPGPKPQDETENWEDNH